MQKLKRTILKIPGSIFLYMTLRKIIALPRFTMEFLKFKYGGANNRRFSISLADIHPCLIDRTTNTDFEPHYTYHPAWAARKVSSRRPEFHVDISSTLHFSTIVSAFVPVKFYDYRPASLNLTNLTSDRADLTKLHFKDNSIDSLSCMHTVEHIGLGRYGDPLDHDGDKKACSELARVLAPNGSLIFVTPIGKPKIAFNAHRIYSYEQVLALFPHLKLKEFSLIPDDFKEKGLIINADPSMVKEQDWACGCFEFTK